MLTTKSIQLWDDNVHVKLQVYILHNSSTFQTNNNRPAVIICPGGGYLYTSDREAEPVALRFASKGYHVFVLRYSTYFNQPVKDLENHPEPNKKATYPQPLFDLAKAMLIIEENAAKWFVDTENIAICGFSAGGHLAASMGVHWNNELLKTKFNVKSFLKPKAIILGYPLINYELMKERVTPERKLYWDTSFTSLFGTSTPSQEQLRMVSVMNFVSKETPPTFIWHTADDASVYVENTLSYAQALTKHHVKYELHVFESGVHGLSLCDHTTAGDPNQLNPDCSIWFELAEKWLQKRINY